MKPVDPLTVIFAHVVATLPDSLAQRQELLQALDCALGARHPGKPAVQALRHALAEVDARTAEVQARFRELLTGGAR